MPYILHASILLAGTFLLYWLLLRNETFFRLNRWILLGSVILSLVLPLITMPAGWSVRVPEVSKLSTHELANSSDDIVTLNIPTDGKVSIIKESEPALLKSNQSSNTEVIIETSDSSKATDGMFSNVSLYDMIWYLYLVGVAIFLLAFLVQLGILLYRIIKYPAIKDGQYRIVELDDDQAPYSFLNCIFINPSSYDLDTYNQIIAHEKIHIEQIHFFDKFIAEGLVIAFWFNPFVWLFRNAITNNLEFLTDESMLDLGTEKESYQMSLLKVSVPHRPLNLTTNYNQSFLKNRIAMMNSKKSSAASSWKYFTLIPVIALSLVTLNAVSLNNDAPIEDISQPFAIEEPQIQNAAPVSADTTKITEAGGTINIIPSTNGNSEIRIFKDKNGKVIREEAHGTIVFAESKDSDGKNKSSYSTHINGGKNWDNLHPGEWSGRIKNNEYCLTFNNSIEGKNWNSYQSTCLPKGEFRQVTNSDGSVLEVMTRDAGTLELYGYWRDNDRGQGDFKFSADPSFTSYLKSEGIKLKHEHQVFNLFITDIDKSYIDFLTKSGFEVDGKGLAALATHNIDRAELKGFMGMFSDLNNKDYDLKDLVQFKIHNVTPEYVNELRGMGMDLDSENVIQAAIHNVEPEFVKAMMDYGLKEADMRDMIQFSIHNVKIDYLKDMKALGYNDLNTKEIVQLNIHNVKPSYVKKFKEMGYDDMDVSDIVQFAIHNIDPDYIKSFKEGGIDNISKKDIVQAGIHNVDVGFVKAMQEAGFQDVDMPDMVQFAIHGVSVDYISDLKSVGLSDLSKREIVQAKIHGVRPEYIKEFRALGMDGLDIDDIVQFAIHGIRPSFVKDFKAAGFDNLSKSDIVQAGIHNVDPHFIKTVRDKGISIGNFGDVINARIHGVSTSFINRANDKGYNPKTLKEYTKLKISGL